MLMDSSKLKLRGSPHLDLKIGFFAAYTDSCNVSILIQQGVTGPRSSSLPDNAGGFPFVRDLSAALHLKMICFLSSYCLITLKISVWCFQY